MLNVFFMTASLKCFYFYFFGDGTGTGRRSVPGSLVSHRVERHLEFRDICGAGCGNGSSKINFLKTCHPVSKW